MEWNAALHLICLPAHCSSLSSWLILLTQTTVPEQHNYSQIQRATERKRERERDGKHTIKLLNPNPNRDTTAMALLAQMIHSPALHHRPREHALCLARSQVAGGTRSRNMLLAHQRRRKRSVSRCCGPSSSSDTGGSGAVDVVELPLFPLPLVLFPGAILPLQIFEFRYRIMMHTLLHTDLRFGVVFSDAGAVTDVGCVGEVVKHERLVDDRFFLICKGQERFRVNRILRTRPYLVAQVTWLEDRPPPPPAPQEDLEALAAEVESYMRDVIRISNRLNGKHQEDKEEGAMDLRRGLFPTPFSFFVGSTFEGAPREQQALLELEDTGARLRRERDTLRNTLNYLTAASAVKDAFPSSPSSPSS